MKIKTIGQEEIDVGTRFKDLNGLSGESLGRLRRNDG